MTKNDHFETQKCHFGAFMASFKISFSSLQHLTYTALSFLSVIRFLNVTIISQPVGGLCHVKPKKGERELHELLCTVSGNTAVMRGTNLFKNKKK